MVTEGMLSPLTFAGERCHCLLATGMERKLTIMRMFCKAWLLTPIITVPSSGLQRWTRALTGAVAGGAAVGRKADWFYILIHVHKLYDKDGLG